MNQTSRIQAFAIYLIIVTSAGIMNHVIIIPVLLQKAGRDSWVSVLLTTVIYLIWLPIMYLIIKWSKKQHVVLWVNENYGKWLSWPIGLIIWFYLFIVGLIALRDTVTWSLSSYLPQTPSYALSIVLLLLCLYAAHSGLRAIAISTGILLPVVILLGHFIATVNLQHKDYSLLFPILEFGWGPVLTGMVYVGAGFSEIFILLLLQHKVKNEIKLRYVLILGIFMSYLTLGPLTGSLAEFGVEEATKQRYPAFEQWRLLEIGRYIEHADFLSIYQWLVGSFIRISITIYLMAEIVDPLRKINRSILLTCFTIILFVANYIISVRDILFIELMFKYLPLNLVFVAVLTFALFFLYYFKRKKGKWRS